MVWFWGTIKGMTQKEEIFKENRIGEKASQELMAVLQAGDRPEPGNYRPDEGKCNGEQYGADWALVQSVTIPAS